MTGLTDEPAERLREAIVRPQAGLRGDYLPPAPLESDLSQAVEDFMRLILAMRRMDCGEHGPRRDDERDSYLALGQLRRSLNRACEARGLS